jgi:hypothetical protein
MRERAVILWLVLATVACSPPSADRILHASAVSLEAISIGANSGVKFVVSTMPENTIERRQILLIFARVVEADNRGVATVKALEGATDARAVLRAVQPILAEIRGAIDSGLIEITDPLTRAKAKAYLEAISASVAAFQAVLEVQ